jgi:hypothetical protein
MPKSDVTFRTIGFIGNVGSGATFKLYLDNEKTGAKTYHIYFKQLGGSGKLTLTTGVAGASNLTMNVGSYVMIVYVDEFGNVSMQGSGTTDTVQSGNTQPVTSRAVSSAIDDSILKQTMHINPDVLRRSFTLAQFEAELVKNNTALPCCGSVKFEAGESPSPNQNWCNYMYIQHRNGIGDDNSEWGVLLLIPFADTNELYLIHRIGGSWLSPKLV